MYNISYLILEQGDYKSKLERGGGEVYLEKRDSIKNAIWLLLKIYLIFCQYVPKTNIIRERFYDNVTTIIHDVNLNVTDDEKITLLLSDHKIIKITANFIIKYMEGRC